MRRALRTLIRLAILGAVAAVGLAAWRRWRGPWPITPQPEWSSATATDEPTIASADRGPDDSSPSDSTPTTTDGVEPVDGQCPDGYPVKGNQSGIYHVPGGRFYERTVPERCYSTPQAAERDGYRRAKV